VHLGTGNYNEVTARFYTDAGLLTAHPVIGEDVAKIFNLITGMGRFPGLQKLFMAPFNLQGDFLRLIERETAHARRKNKNAKNKTAPRIIAKMNSLVDPEVIKALYRASQAGVSIDLIVRGVCCLRPGLPGVSENIRVRSIVDRFLEHSRIYYFANAGDEEIHLGSADWMPRNFFNRVEVIFPLQDAALKARVKDEILHAALADNVKARLMTADGLYQRPKRTAKKPPLRAQQWLMERATQSATGQSAAGQIADFPGNRPAPLPLTATPSTLAPTVPQIIPRSAPPPSWVLPPGDGRAGTTTDPVLQSLKQSLAPASDTGKVEQITLSTEPDGAGAPLD
jgi:polyphosphate kinase